MPTADILIYAMLAIPLLGSLVAAYVKIKVGPFFGIIVAAGAAQVLLSYLAFDLQAALLQLAALGLGAVLFLASIGLFGEKISYRSPMILLASVGLFPLGITAATGYTAPLVVFTVLIGANVLFALLLVYLRRNTFARRRGEEKPKGRYLLAVPAILSALIVGLMFIAELSKGTLV